ncbi:hypothetical protein LEP1GSC021_5064 [Leptospira noguchii str. 1993005606]|uniref:hypothetical protein n=1 Tax=Leptospira noguchii TaxID=28182 RepID=UPI0002F0F728|nr:hypothetical protein [Leptospira noguchii]EPE83808.1 hypothetical protein LEP1GSC021_5064 [Leptospira noguchii str. 1993005606]
MDKGWWFDSFSLEAGKKKFQKHFSDFKVLQLVFWKSFVLGSTQVPLLKLFLVPASN